MRLARYVLFLRALVLAVLAGGGAHAVAQQLVTDAPIAKAGGTAYVGKYTADSVFSAGPTFHFTAPVTITSIAYDPGPGGVQELSVRSLQGCSIGSITAAGTVCGIETAIASRYPGTRFGTLRVRTTANEFIVPVEWDSIGAQVAVTPGVLLATSLAEGVTANSLALDAVGNLFLSGNNLIRKVDAGSQKVSTIAGTPGDPSRDGDGGAATAAHIGSPVGVTVSPAGDIYFVASAANANDTVRKINVQSGLISTVVQLAHGGPGTVAVDDQGNIYTSDPGNNALTVTSGDGATSRSLIGAGSAGSQACNAGGGFLPGTLAVSHGYVYFASGATVYRVSADTTACHTPTLVAGTGIAGNNGDGGLAAKAAIGAVVGLAVDAADDVYIADANAQAVRMVSASTGIITTLAGAGSALPGVTVGAGLSSLALDVRGNLYVLSANGAVQKIDVSSGALHYAPTAIGHLSSDSPQGVVFTNIGNDDLSSPDSVLVLPSGGFAETAATTTCGRGNASSLAPGAGCEVAVDFTPIETGVSSGILGFAKTVVYLQGSTTTATQPKPSYTAWVEPGAVTVQQGGSNTAKFVFAPAGGFRGAVSFACSGLPAGAVCTFAPGTLMADGSDAQQTSTLTVNMRGAATLASVGGTGSRSFALTAICAAAMLLMWLKLRRNGSRSLPLLAVLLLLCTSVAGITGCGAGGALQTSAQAVSTQVNVVSTSAVDGSKQMTSFVLTLR